MEVIFFKNSDLRFSISTDKRFIFARIYDIDNRLCFCETVPNSEKNLQLIKDEAQKVSDSFEV